MEPTKLTATSISRLGTTRPRTFQNPGSAAPCDSLSRAAESIPQSAIRCPVGAYAATILRGHRTRPDLSVTDWILNPFQFLDITIQVLRE
jgi:hypothetical protein